MATATRKRTKNLSVSKTALDQAGSLLQDLPEKTKEHLSLREAVDQLRESIKSALSKGYGYDEVAALLADKEILISASTLKRYVLVGGSRSNKTKASTKTRTRQSRKGSEPVAAAAQAGQSVGKEAIASIQPADAGAGTPAKSRGGRKSAAVEAKPEPKTKVSTGAKTGRGRTRTSASAPASEAPKKATRSTRSSTVSRKKRG